MRISLSLVAGISMAFTLGQPARAEETPVAQELRELRQVVQQQSKQLEILAQQVGRLTRVLESRRPGEAPTATTSIEAPAPAPAAAPEFAPEAPKAEAVNAGPRHIVVKGETLTSIAKQYNIPIADLKNANKIENERKLQIGQVLTLPTAKIPETPDKKETP